MKKKMKKNEKKMKRNKKKLRKRLKLGILIRIQRYYAVGFELGSIV